jgi:hypothetical protein
LSSSSGGGEGEEEEGEEEAQVYVTVVAEGLVTVWIIPSGLVVTTFPVKFLVFSRPAAS